MTVVDEGVAADDQIHHGQVRQRGGDEALGDIPPPTTRRRITRKTRPTEQLRRREEEPEESGRRVRPRLESAQQQLHGAHQMQIVGPIAFCELCGRFAIERHGIGLQGNCTGIDPNVKLRVERMRRGQHPLTGASLINS